MDPIEVGQKYRRRDGRIVIITEKVNDRGNGCSYFVHGKTEDGQSMDAVWGDGSYSGMRTASPGYQTPVDLVERIDTEYEPEQLDLFGEL